MDNFKRIAFAFLATAVFTSFNDATAQEVEGNCALHVKNDKPHRAINFGKNKNSYNASLVNGEVLEEAFEKIDL